MEKFILWAGQVLESESALNAQSAHHSSGHMGEAYPIPGDRMEQFPLYAFFKPHVVQKETGEERGKVITFEWRGRSSNPSLLLAH